MQSISEEATLRILSQTDPLTGILNRKAFSDKVSILLNSKSDIFVAILMLDLDGFKSVNNCYGHDVGDKLLVDVGKSLMLVIDKNDFVGRIGGDEFMVCICSAKSISDIENIAIQINNKIQCNFINKVKLSASIGISVNDKNNNSFDKLYKLADMALYHVKYNCKGSYEFYNDKMNSNDNCHAF